MSSAFMFYLLLSMYLTRSVTFSLMTICLQLTQHLKEFKYLLRYILC